MTWKIWTWGFFLLVTLSNGYRLPESILPKDYKLEIITNLGNVNDSFTFSGKVWIEVACIQSTNNVTLHSKNLNIDKENVYVRSVHSKSSKSMEITSVNSDKENEFLVIHLAKELQAGKKYEIYIPFAGEIEQGLAGYYRSNYIDNETKERRWIAVTQFEPSDARRAFPCFDEPAMKATFTINLGRHKKYSSISNMPLIKTEPMKDRAGWEWDRFETSVPVSTYLIAYVVSDFDYKISPQVDDNNVTFRVWSRKDALEQVEFAKDIGPKILNFYEHFFDIPYPLPKQDMIALPDFAAGAMENWGLITYRETYLLYDPKVSSTTNKFNVASVVAHEIAHQWFGNLVTMKWWTDLWLNEGFATYMAAIAVNEIFPEWKSLQGETVDNLLGVFSFDSLQNSHPVSVPIGNPKEIQEIFDTISYKKGSYLLHMMANFLGIEVLRKAVSNYLKMHEYNNAEQDDLWESITAEAHTIGALPKDLTMKLIMDTWTLQTGYPVITVTRKYGENSLEVKQSIFLRNTLNTEDLKRYWYIPLSYTTEEEQEFNVTKPKLWMPPVSETQTIEGFPDDHGWVIFNIGASGLYRVNYDEKNWNLLIDTLKSDSFSEIPVLNRVLLIDDAANLAWVGQLDYGVFFDVVTYLSKESEYLPWKAALRNIGSLKNLLKRTSTYGLFKEYMTKLLKPIYDKIGGFHEPYETDNSLDAVQHRVLITGAACRYNVDHCVTEAVKLFKNLQEFPSEKEHIPKDLRGIVYCNGIKYGGETDWDFLWNQYLTSNVAAEKNTILRSLGCTQHIWLLQRYLEWALDPNSRIRKQDIAQIFSSVISNDIGFYIARNFIYENIESLHKRLHPTVNKLSGIMSSLSSYMVTDNDYEWLQNFTKTNNKFFKDIKNGISQSMEMAKLNAQWHNENMKHIGQLLTHYI